jgi:hypothetical protein
VRAEVGLNPTSAGTVYLCAVAYLRISEGWEMVRSQEARSNGATIAGGFVLISVAGLIAAWRACRHAPLGTGDFRAWLAAHEMVARRRAADRDRSPIYTFAELARLTGVSQRAARTSVRRLQAAGLIEWSEQAIAFPEPPIPPVGLDDTIGGGEGDVAIPRRMLKLLVEGARPALIAVALAIVLRCLSRRRAGFDGRGRVKASWISATFGIDLSRVKIARAELVQLGWIQPQPSDQWAMNRWGKAYTINLDWDRASTQGRQSPPPLPPGGRQSPPPDLQTPIPSGRNNHQEPAGGQAGFSIEGPGEKTPPRDREPVGPKPVPTPSPTATGMNPTGRATTIPAETTRSSTAPAPTLPAPKLADVRPEDLKDTGRLLELFDQAMARKLIGPSEADRLRFVAAAEHALAIGKANPCGLFAYLIRGACWRYITQADEDQANGRIKAHLRGPAPPRVTPGMGRPSSRSALSEDAQVVLRVRAALSAAGYRGDPYPQVRRHDASWTRERWDAALLDLRTTGAID